MVGALGCNPPPGSKVLDDKTIIPGHQEYSNPESVVEGSQFPDIQQCVNDVPKNFEAEFRWEYAKGIAEGIAMNPERTI